MRRFMITQDYEKVVDMFNEMSKKGYRFEKNNFGYVFKECEKDKYQYQIDYYSAFSKTSNEYYQFIKSMNINIVYDKMGFMILEKENDGTAFELYTDYDSKFKRNLRFSKIWIFVLVITLVNLFIAFNINYENSVKIGGIPLNIILYSLLFFMTLTTLIVSVK